MKPRDLLEYLRREHGEFIAGWCVAGLVRHLDTRNSPKHFLANWGLLR